METNNQVIPNQNLQLDRAAKKTILRKRPLLIAGPCSAESEEQVMETARALAAIGKVDILRAGIWKPRTRPGNFEGLGEIALPWMQKASLETGIPFIIEVATAAQVETALKYGAHFLWIGARSTANPFSVQEVADALKGVDIPVFIKNPTNPDVELWMGAVERVAKAGIQEIGLIHRGFSFYGPSEYRNAPTWQLALEMKRRLPELPFLIDPSHISGKRVLIKGIIQQAIDLNYDGIIVESHIHPDSALSDAAQQVTPENLARILEDIVWRKEKYTSEELQAELARFRRQIDYLDDEVLEILSKRMQIAEEIGQFKKKNYLTILQAQRWKATMKRMTLKAKELGLTSEFIQEYYDAIHFESIRHQDKVMNKKQPNGTRNFIN